MGLSIIADLWKTSGKSTEAGAASAAGATQGFTFIRVSKRLSDLSLLVLRWSCQFGEDGEEGRGDWEGRVLGIRGSRRAP